MSASTKSKALFASLIALCLVIQACGGMDGLKPQLVSASSPSPSPPPQITPAINDGLFGMHIHRIDAGTPWPAARITTWRLWDAGVAWKDLEPASGVFNFSLLDQYVAVAQEHSTEILLTLGYTPQWASQRPQEPSDGGPGSSAPPSDIGSWDKFITALVTRYKGRIQAYEILNEPNLAKYFTGSVADQFVLLKHAYMIIKQIDPSATVLSPGYMGKGFLQLDQLLAMGGAQYIDVVAYHFYDFPAKPEAMDGFIKSVLNVLTSHQIDKPIWDTEIGYGPGQTFSGEDQQASYFVRTIMVHWNDKIERAYWYAWDNHGWARLWMTEPDSTTLTKAGTAYNVLYTWISNAQKGDCSISQSAAINSCSLVLADGKLAHILWMSTGQTSFALPPDWHATAVQDLKGINTPLGSTVPVTESPALVF